MLRTLANWKPVVQQTESERYQVSFALSDASNGPSLKLGAANKRLKEALIHGEYQLALTEWEALLSQAPTTTHPIARTTYDQLLFEWNRLGMEQKMAKMSKPMDLELMLLLLEELVVLKRVNARAFNTALVACNKLNALEVGLRVLQLMKTAQCQPGVFAYTNLISCCARQAKQHKRRQDVFVQHAEQLWQEMIDMGIEPRIEVVNAMLYVYRAAKNRSMDADALVAKAVREMKLVPNGSTIATLLECMLKDGTSREATRWLEYALRHQIEVEPPHARVLLDFLRQRKSWHRCNNLVALLKARGLVHQDQVMKQTINYIRKRNSRSLVLQAINTGVLGKDQGVGPRVRYSRDLGGLVRALKQGKHGELSRVPKSELEKMIQSGSTKDIVTLILLMHSVQLEGALPDASGKKQWTQVGLQSLANARCWWRATEIIQELVKQRSDAELDIECFNSALAACTKAGRVEEASDVLSMIEQAKDVVPNRKTYELMLGCYAECGDADAALRCYQKMNQAGFAPTVINLNTVLKSIAVAVQQGLTEASSHEREEASDQDLGRLAVQAAHHFRGAIDNHDIQPTQTSIYFLFRSFLGAPAAMEDDEEEEGISQPSFQHIMHMIQATCRDAPLEMLSPRAFNVALDVLQRRGDANACFEVYNTMISRGYMPTTDTIRLLFDVCCHSESAELGHLLLDHLVSELELEGDSKAILRRTIAQEALRWAASTDAGVRDQVVAKLTEAGLPLNEEGYERIIGMYGLQGNISEARKLLHEMLEKLGYVTTDACNRELQACSTAKAPVAALDTIAWMKRQRIEPDIVSFNTVLSAIRRGITRPLSHAEDPNANEEEEEEDREDDEVQQRPEQKPRNRFLELEQNVSSVVSQLLEEMKQREVLPNELTYSNIVALCASRGDVDGVLAIVDEAMHQSQVHRTDLSELLNQTSLTGYLDACAAKKSTDRIKALHQMLEQWRREQAYHIPPAIALKLLAAYDAVDEWRSPLSLVKDITRRFGLQPSVLFFRAVMSTCNRVGKYRYAEQIFETMQKPGAYRVYPDAESYVEAIYACEQQEKWPLATDLFMEMRRKCADEDLPPSLLNKIALGRYSEGRRRIN
ncbi:hypothetical protein Poli38472_006637 [Pythium oligandrum]|uniref:Pentacotripeptide-repeat region of PRORP domain-containing protein n=1 Tax=Pythium oligandrum TaxID=41045 RepID=A0A8K1FEH0_PYTOL|nr:hypothetical protein Poli38472_006637 [Pythium oligandrum]|eukprot:TMW56627.1 hypothetical protein Poli38472_006637 [Pythium oligandrum]